mgnify:CR=1 FL=1
MRKIIIRNNEYQYRGYYLILGFLLFPATDSYESKEVVKDIFNIY